MYVQRGHNFAIVDEVDSILIDEARTPLIICGPGRGVDRQVLPRRPDHPEAEAGRAHHRRQEGRGARRAREDRRLHRRREGQDGHAHREGMAHAEKLLGGRRTSATPANMDVLHHVNQGAARAHALPPRRRLRGEGRPGHDRRRVHRPADARPALVRRPAPGGRGQGEGQDRAREPDARHDHLPELLPHVRQARRA